MRTAVVGAGIHGLCTARALRKRGHDVALFDRYEPGHVHGSSHGRSRIIRKAYPDPFYTGIMTEGYGLWDELQAECARRFVHHTGILYFGPAENVGVRDVQSSLRANDVPFEIVGPEQSAVPTLRLGAGEAGVLSNDGGWVHADLAIAELFSLCRSQGVQWVSDAAESADVLDREFDAYVVATGAWITDFIPLDVEILVRTVAYLEHEYEGAVWIEDGPDLLYGFPTAPGETTIKIGVHMQGPRWDRSSPRPGVDETSLAKIADFAKRRFGIESPRFTETLTCLYTMTPDEDFRWGRVGKRGCYVSACSGHGFKFGPWIGERMADFIEQRKHPEEFPRFCR